jgi:hypothetical protein
MHVLNLPITTESWKGIGWGLVDCLSSPLGSVCNIIMVINYPIACAYLLVLHPLLVASLSPLIQNPKVLLFRYDEHYLECVHLYMCSVSQICPFHAHALLSCFTEC